MDGGGIRDSCRDAPDVCGLAEGALLDDLPALICHKSEENWKNDHTRKIKPEQTKNDRNSNAYFVC